jgi:hypothetical protein
MRRPLFLTWLVLDLAGACLLGCGSARRPYLDDPLLMTKRPVEGKIGAAEPVGLAFAEPTAPALPATALASLPTKPPRPFLEDVPRSAVSGVAKRDMSDTEIDRASPPAVAALPVARQQVLGTYGYAPDYSWLQGVLDQGARGQSELRYTDSTTPDAHGGKVELVDDPRLTTFQTGDVLWLAGELVPERDPPTEAAGKPVPRYRIHAVRLIQPPSSPVLPRARH